MLALPCGYVCNCMLLQLCHELNDRKWCMPLEDVLNWGGCCELEGVVSWIDFVGDTCPSVVVEVNEKHPEELPVGQRCC